jgi:hypothetical protein
VRREDTAGSFVRIMEFIASSKSHQQAWYAFGVLWPESWKESGTDRFMFIDACREELVHRDRSQFLQFDLNIFHSMDSSAPPGEAVGGLLKYVVFEIRGTVGESLPRIAVGIHCNSFARP